MTTKYRVTKVTDRSHVMYVVEELHVTFMGGRDHWFDVWLGAEYTSSFAHLEDALEVHTALTEVPRTEVVYP
jgi:hypothetical protein